MRGRAPFARTVEDAALMLEIMAGPSTDDPFVLPDTGPDFVGATTRSVTGLNVGYSVDMGVFPIDESVRSRFTAAIDELTNSELSLQEASPEFSHPLEEMRESWETGFKVVLAEAMENMKAGGLDLLGDHRDELDPHNVEAAEAGLEISAVEYRQADVVRTTVFDEVQAFFDDHDVLLTPTIAVAPFEHGIWGPEEVAGESVDPIVGWCLTWLFNMTGHPAASVPIGFTDDGLPIGMQIVGKRHGDEDVLAVSAAVERRSPWYSSYAQLH